MSTTTSVGRKNYIKDFAHMCVRRGII